MKIINGKFAGPNARVINNPKYATNGLPDTRKLPIAVQMDEFDPSADVDDAQTWYRAGARFGRMTPKRLRELADALDKRSARRRIV